MVRRLPEFHLCHPIEKLAGIEIAKDSSLKLQEKRRMDGITQIEQRVRPSHAFEQFPFRDADATHRIEIVCVSGWILVKQAISAGEAVLAHPALEIVDLSLVFAGIFRCRQ